MSTEEDDGKVHTNFKLLVRKSIYIRTSWHSVFISTLCFLLCILEIPPLEDMSDLIKQVNEIREAKQGEKSSSTPPTPPETPKTVAETTAATPVVRERKRNQVELKSQTFVCGECLLSLESLTLLA